MFRRCTGHVLTVARGMFDLDRGLFRPFSKLVATMLNFISTVREVFFDRRSWYVSTVARSMFRPCSSWVFDSAQGMFQPCLRFVSTVLEAYFDRAQGMLRPCSRNV